MNTDCLRVNGDFVAVTCSYYSSFNNTQCLQTRFRGIADQRVLKLA